MSKKLKSVVESPRPFTATAAPSPRAAGPLSDAPRADKPALTPTPPPKGEKKGVSPRPVTKAGCKEASAPGAAGAKAPLASEVGETRAAIAKARAARRSSLDEMRSTRDLDDQFADLFRVADEDFSGGVQFHEFLAIHQTMTRHMGDKLKHRRELSTEDLQREFRELDSDHDLQLDLDEFSKFLTGVRDAVGPSMFSSCCATIKEEDRLKKAPNASYDTASSYRLLDKVKQVSHLRDAIGEEVLSLLDKKANPDFYDLDGGNVLYFAMEKADLHFVKTLLKTRANPMRLNKKTMSSACFIAAQNNNLDVMQLLMLPPRAAAELAAEKEADIAGLNAKLIKDMHEMTGTAVLNLLTLRADMNYKDPFGWSPLLVAAFHDKRDCVQSLIAAGQTTTGTCNLRLNITDSHCRTALHIAARKGFSELITPLLRAHASPDQKDVLGWTPLHHAVFNGKDVCVDLLVKVSSLTATDHMGFTPWMLANSPSHAAELMPSSLKLIEPPEGVNFSKVIIPILGNGDSVYQKMQAILSLAKQNFDGLRLYEAFFSVRGGPNKVRLQKMYESITKDLLKRLQSGETELEPGGPHMDKEAVMELNAERELRRREQKRFLKNWLLTTMGPPPSEEWQHNNRECYIEDLEATAKEEAEGFRKIFDQLAKALEDDGGIDDIPIFQEFDKERTTQCHAHPILRWLDNMDVALVFDSLRHVGALGPNARTDEEALIAFAELVGLHPDFATGQDFWQNVYKFWLAHYALLVQPLFQAKVKGIVQDFNAKFAEEKHTAKIYVCTPKTYEAMKRKELRLGRPSHDSVEGRRGASRFLDIVRCSITASSPDCARQLLQELLSFNIKTHKLGVTQLANHFHSDTTTPDGYRDIVLNVIFSAGTVTSAAKKPGAHLWSEEMELGIIGEIRINLENFLAVKRQMSLISKLLAGDFTHPAGVVVVRKVVDDEPAVGSSEK